jgi:hypothetical protein
MAEDLDEAPGAEADLFDHLADGAGGRSSLKLAQRVGDGRMPLQALACHASSASSRTTNLASAPRAAARRARAAQGKAKA